MVSSSEDIFKGMKLVRYWAFNKCHTMIIAVRYACYGMVVSIAWTMSGTCGEL